MTPLKKTTGDPSRRSRDADPALERETNKITKDLGAAHRGASRQRSAKRN